MNHSAKIVKQAIRNSLNQNSSAFSFYKINFNMWLFAWPQRGVMLVF